MHDLDLCPVPEAEKAALKQFDRLKVMQPSSAEYTVTRTYLEWLVELPWVTSTDRRRPVKSGSAMPVA